MTLAQRLSGEITDIKFIEFACKTCGAAVSFNPVNWNAMVPSRCTNCPNAPTWTPTTDQNIRHFAVLLTQLIKAARDMPFQIS